MFIKKATELRDKFSLENLVKGNVNEGNTLDDQLFRLYEMPGDNEMGGQQEMNESKESEPEIKPNRKETSPNPFDDMVEEIGIKSTNPFESSYGEPLPNDTNNDTPLKRFITRRFGISNISQDLGFASPRSEKDIMAALDHQFYTSNFDPVKYVLDSLPQVGSDYIAYLDKEISEKDVALRSVLSKLSDEVQEHYNDLVDGMKFVQQVDLGLAQAGVQIANSRRKLGRAREDLVAEVLSTVGKRHRRDRLYRVQGVARRARTVLAIEKDVTKHIEAGDFSAAVEAAADARLAVEEGVMADIMLLDQMRERLDAMLPRIAQRTDSVLGAILGRAAELDLEFQFDPAEYEEIVQAYMVLDDHGISAGQMMQGKGQSLMAGLSGLAELIKSFVRKEAEKSLERCVKKGLASASTKTPVFHGYSPSTDDLCGLLPIAQLVDTSLSFCGACASLLHLYYLLIQWHRCPFDAQNGDLEYLHRCRVDFTEEGINESIKSLEHKTKEGQGEDSDSETSVSDSGTSGRGDAFSQALEDTQLLKERRKQLERARLNVVHHGLVQGRRVVWECIQARAVTLLTGQDLSQASLRSEDLAAVLATFNLLMAFGQEFSSTRETASLSGCLGLKCRQFYAALQAEAMDALRQMLDRESWGRVPVKIQGQDHRALQEIVNGFKRELNWQSHYTTWGQFSNLLKDHSQGRSLLMQWHKIGNPFRKRTAPSDEAENKNPFNYPQKTASLAKPFEQGYSEEVPEYDREEDEIFAEIQQFGSRWIVTQAALNGVTLYLGRHIQVMELAPTVALEVFQGMCQLVDFYLFVVFTLFVPEQRIAALLGHGQEGDRLLHCEEDQFSSLRGFVSRAAVGAGRTFSGKGKKGGRVTRGGSPMRQPQGLSRGGGNQTSEEGQSPQQDGIASRLSMLPEYVVATESCSFVSSVLLSTLPQVLDHVPEAQRHRCEKYVDSIQNAVEQLKIFIYRSISPYLIDSSRIIDIIQQQDWLKKKIQNHENRYVNDIIQSCEELWKTLQAGIRTDSLNLIPCSVREMIWSEVVQSLMCALVEGFSRIKKCSTEGRALMSMDLQAIQLGLDEIKRTRPLRGRVYVDSYIKAFYYGDADLIRWIQESWQSYHRSQMISLASCGTAGKMRRRKIKDIASQVEALYPQSSNSESASPAVR